MRVYGKSFCLIKQNLNLIMMARYYGGLFYRSDLFNYIMIETYCMKNNCTITDLQSRFNKETFKYSPFLNDYSKEISIFQYCFVIWLLIFGLVLILCVTYRINVEEERLFNLNKRLFQPPPYESLKHGVCHTQRSSNTLQTNSIV